MTGQGRQRIDYSEAEQMLRNGATQQDVADRFGVTQAGVSRAIERGRIKGIESDRSVKGNSGVPWYPIRAEHRNRYLVRMLRAAARRERGEKSSPVIEATLDVFLRKFEEDDFVIHYEPDTPEGFFRVHRRPGIDMGMVRDPWIDDSGGRVERPPNVKRQGNGK